MTLLAVDRKPSGTPATTRLCISVLYLSDTYHGVEWPPSPMRLFQALIAGHHQGRVRSVPDVDFPVVMRWLECLPPPVIQACEVSQGRRCRVFVPNNDDDIAMRQWAKDKPESPLDRAKRYTEKSRQPWFLTGDRSVYYFWEIPHGEENRAQAVVDSAVRIIALGWGVDMVVAKGHWVSGEIPQLGIGYRPCSNPQTSRVLRTPIPGSYDATERRYQAFLRSGLHESGLTFTKPPLDYCQVRYTRDGEQAESHYACFRLLTLDGRANYRRDARQTVALAAMVRHAVHEVLQREPDFENQLRGLMGHGDKGNQVALLPMPTVGHQHADGLIRRVMLKTPDAETLRRLTWALDGWELKVENEPVALLSLIEESDAVVAQFTRPSEWWESVTPVVLPGYDRLNARKHKTEKLISRALAQSGFALSQVKDFWYQSAPWQRHGHRAGGYQVARYMHYPQYHVRLCFQQPIKGPVALGMGRYLGLGLMSNSRKSESGNLRRSANLKRRSDHREVRASVFSL